MLLMRFFFSIILFTNFFYALGVNQQRKVKRTTADKLATQEAINFIKRPMKTDEEIFTSATNSFAPKKRRSTRIGNQVQQAKIKQQNNNNNYHHKKFHYTAHTAIKEKKRPNLNLPPKADYTILMDHFKRTLAPGLNHINENPTLYNTKAQEIANIITNLLS